MWMSMGMGTEMKMGKATPIVGMWVWTHLKRDTLEGHNGSVDIPFKQRLQVIA